MRGGGSGEAPAAWSCFLLRSQQPFLPPPTHLLQRPEDNGESEGYAGAQEDGLRDDREEELGLGRPAGRSQGMSASALNTKQREETGRLEKTPEPGAWSPQGHGEKGHGY